MAQIMEDRFWRSVEIRGNNQCWPWKRWRNPKGYGRFRIGSKKHLSHRVAFFIAYGYWPRPMCLHTCDNTWCCNPQHLYEGTGKDNAKDRKERGRWVVSEETRRRMSKAHMGKPSGRKGKKASPETIAKMRAANLGRKASPETRQKLSESLKAAWDDPDKRAKIMGGRS